MDRRASGEEKWMMREKQTGVDVGGRNSGVIKGTVPAFTDRYRHPHEKKYI
jgi:hypothetical protein